MTEVPIIFPSHAASPPRFVVNDVNCTIFRSRTQNDSSSGKKPHLLEDVSTQAIHCGGASMSSLDFQGTGKTAILTTSLLLDNPRVLSVSLLGHDPDSPVIIELDLGSEIKDYGNTVKVQAFVEARNGQVCIRLVLVADNAVVLTVRLQPSNLAPLDSQQGVEVFNVQDILDDDPAAKEAVRGSLIHKTMVTFYSPTAMVLALSPLLMSVDLESKTGEVWLESQCLEDMRARESAIGSIFSKASDLLLGRLDDGSLVDMAPTAALCVSHTANPLLDPTFVFTLHSDGKIKRWTVSDASLRPMEVYPIIIDMPAPRDWSDMHNSVYLTARLYGQVYVLAVHVQTNSVSSFTDRDERAEMGSSSHLYVVYGGKDNSEQNGEALKMVVPSETEGLVDMDFSPNSNCSLTVMFRSTTSDQSAAPTTLTVLYPKNVVSIISTQPEIAPVEFFLDGVAQTERSRIGALIFSDELEGIASSNRPIEDEIHEMDARFMKYLFKPSHPRGNGTVTAPTNTHILNALDKCLPSRIRRAKEDGPAHSIQLETIRAVQEWRARDNRQVITSPRQKNKTSESQPESTSMVELEVTKARSVYDAYVSFDDGEENDEPELRDSEIDQLERERVFLLDMHSRRWRLFLLAIWEDEQSLRSPLGLFLLANSKESGAVLVRAGFTSILAVNSRDDGSNQLEQLDAAALKLMQALESHEDSCKKLFATEQRIWNAMAKAQQETTPSDFASECSRIVDFAFDSARGAVFSVREQQQLGQSLGTIPLEDYFVLLQDTPREQSLPGLNLIDTTRGVVVRDPTTPRNIVANSQVRQAVCALSVRCMDSSRRLLLARYLLVSYLVRSSHVSTVAFFAYLRLLAVMWAGSQQVPMPPAFAKAQSAKGLSDQPPKKRLSFGDSSSSFLANSAITTCMDSLLISILQSRANSQENSPMGLVLSLSRDLFCSSMRPTVPTAEDAASGKLHVLIPELGALPPSSSSSAATDYPRLALRLIAPLVALGCARAAPNVATARKETLAECLLVESHKLPSETTKSKLRIIACDLLALNPTGSGNLQDTVAAFETLTPRATPLLSEDSSAEPLSEILQVIIHGDEGEIRSGIKSLVKLETVRTLFGCLLRDALHGGTTKDVEDAVKHLSPKLLHLSNLMHRVDILEHHVGRSKGSNEFILQFINGAIREVNDLFPIEVRATMPEYLSLYSSLFHMAVSGRDWNQAYDACLNNPSSERKVNNFKRLVNSMVDTGALQELMNKCSTLASPASGLFTESSVDLYSIAADALGEASSRDLYLVRACSEDAQKAAPDYQGSLYSLHASRGQWRKAAQSLDLRYVNAMRAVANVQGEQSPNSKTALVRERLIVEDLVLASVGTANAASLVDDVAAQYIVSGEQGLVEAWAGPEGSEAKRGRDPGLDSAMQEPSSLDRISQFMTLKDLHGRATWSFGLRKLCLDMSASSYTQTSALLDNGSPCVNKKALDELSEAGYYFNYLLLTLAMSKTGPFGGKVGSAFHDSLLDLLSNTLVPMSIDTNFTSTKRRPSLPQIGRPLDSVGGVPGSAPCVIAGRFKHHSTGIQICLQSLSAEFVQKLSTLHTSAEHPVGLHVANFILEYDDTIAQLPNWLEQQLMVGVSRAESAQCDGLFEKRRKPGASAVYLGDPSALMSLYLRQGMLLEACHVVVETLSGGVGGEAGKNHPRVPEKGDIVFVPYKKIDILWNVIDNALGKASVDEETKFKLRHGHDLLLQAVEKHLVVIKENQMGLRSARALKHQLHFL